MELRKAEIDNANWKVKNAMEFTVDETINVPDHNLDIEQLVLVKGNVQVDETQAMEGRFQVKGNLCYQILYCANEEQNVFDSIEGKVPFVEYINADGTTEGDYIEQQMSLNDLTVSMLHSRKLSMKSLVGIDYQVKNREKMEVVTAIEDAKGAKLQSGALSMMCLRMQEKKTLELSSMVQLPANKPNIYQVIWKSLSLTGMQVKPSDGRLIISGTICMFLIYTSADEEVPMQYVTMEIPFEQSVEDAMVNEDMVSGCTVTLRQYTMHIGYDENGQERQIELRLELEVDCKLYGLEEMTILKDAYSLEQTLLPKFETIMVAHLIMRNCAKTRVVENVTLPKNHSILQICNVEGSALVEETQQTAKGIMVEGIVGCQVTYLNKEQGGRLNCTNFDLPFSYEIEIPDKQRNLSYSIMPAIDRISAVAKGEGELEIKVDVSLDVLAFKQETERVIVDVAEEPLDMERKNEMPAVIGYRVKPNDSLWEIAKCYYTTVERIQEINGLENTQLEEGSSLVIVKE